MKARIKNFLSNTLGAPIIWKKISYNRHQKKSCTFFRFRNYFSQKFETNKSKKRIKKNI
jgi:hypothetical protein